MGTELTEGSTHDTHGPFIAALLHAAGLKMRSILLIPDDGEQYGQVLREAIRSCDVVIITGGLGPTSDDLTREIVAEVCGRELEFHDDLWREIEQRFSGRPLSHTNRKQALIPAGFTAIPNPYGTAPAFWGEVARAASQGGIVVALPGPPRELRPIFADIVMPLLVRELSLEVLDELRLTVFLVSESTVEELLRELRAGSVEWGTRAEAYRIVVVLRGGSEPDREAMFASLENRVGQLRLRRGEVDAAELVFSALQAASSTLATAESCTGGLVAKLITDLAGSSGVFWGALVAYANDAKTRVLKVPQEVIETQGAVSRETVVAMVAGAIELARTDFACAISGVAGPSGGTPEKPVGTVWIAAGKRGGRVSARHFHFTGNRDMVRRKSAVAALLMCEGTIGGKEVDKSDLWQYI